MTSYTGISDEVHRSQLVAILQHAVSPMKHPLDERVDPFQVVSRDIFCERFPLDASRFMLSYENRFRDPFHCEGTMAVTKPWLHYIYAMVAIQKSREIYPLVDIERGKFISDALALCYHHDFRYAELSYKALLAGLESEGSLELSEVVFHGALEFIGLEDKIQRVNSSIAHLIQGSIEYRGTYTKHKDVYENLFARRSSLASIIHPGALVTYNDIYATEPARKVMVNHLDWLSLALKHCVDREFSEVGWHAARLYPLPTRIMQVEVEHNGASSLLSLAHTQVYNIITSRNAPGIQRQAVRHIMGNHIDSLRAILSRDDVRK